MTEKEWLALCLSSLGGGRRKKVAVGVDGKDAWPDSHQSPVLPGSPLATSRSLLALCPHTACLLVRSVLCLCVVVCTSTASTSCLPAASSNRTSNHPPRVTVTVTALAHVRGFVALASGTVCLPLCPPPPAFTSPMPALATARLLHSRNATGFNGAIMLSTSNATGTLPECSHGPLWVPAHNADPASALRILLTPNSDTSTESAGHTRQLCPRKLEAGASNVGLGTDGIACLSALYRRISSVELILALFNVLPGW
jgi:hypothetical protein